MKVDHRFEDAIKEQEDQERRTKMEAPKFPPKQIVKVIMEETQSKFNKTEDFGLNHDDEFQWMVHEHISEIKKLETYEEIDSWLQSYRRLSLAEWVESL